jgi:23S rRNA (cytosine1962-C5)-methyltransferase
MPVEESTMIDVVLAPDRERSVRRRHPWIWSGAIARTEGTTTAGDVVRVLSSAGDLLGFGHHAPGSKLVVRMLTFDKIEPDDAWLAERIAEAVDRRAGDPELVGTDALRLVNAEGDGLPGLIVDRYADAVVVKCTTAGMASRREAIVDALRGSTHAALGYERSDAAYARREGFAARAGVLWGDGPPSDLPFREGGMRLSVDVAHGQKTGFYLDQRDSRALTGRLAAGRRCLDLFSYSGGFATAAALGGASQVTLVDSSADALRRAESHLEANAPATPRALERADAFAWVRANGDPYDLIVLDPPPLARARRDVPRASRAYKDALLFALRRAAPGAYLLAFSCSHHVGPDLFRKIAFGASLDADRPVRVLRTLSAPTDHPVSIDHPEGAYFTGLLLRA